MNAIERTRAWAMRVCYRLYEAVAPDAINQSLLEGIQAVPSAIRSSD